MSSSELSLDAAHAAGDDWRELANRAGNGLEVSRLWSKSADRVKVSVSDAAAQPEEYERRVVGFFDRALLPRTG
jgi:hypothetical protein